MEFSLEKFIEVKALKGVKSTQLANAVGVARGTISHWEAGRAKPNKKLFPKIAEALGCNVEDFIVNEGDLSNQMRAILRDDEGRIKHETRFDSNGNPYREHWNLELTPNLWRRMEQNMVKTGYLPNEVDGYLQNLIAEHYRNLYQTPTPENQMTEEDTESN